MFQSPKSGKFESNLATHMNIVEFQKRKFQSPKSGKFESNAVKKAEDIRETGFQSPRSGKFESNSLKNALRLTMGF